MKEDPLKLAEEIAWYDMEIGDMAKRCADMIRRLVEERNGYQNAYAALLNHNIAKSFPRNSLSDEEIDGLAENCWYTDEDLQIFNHKKFAKLLEERHGIK